MNKDTNNVTNDSMISHGLKKCTQVHSVLVGVMFTGSKHHHHRCLENTWLVRERGFVTNNYPPPKKPSSPPELRPEKQKRKSFSPVLKSSNVCKAGGLD